MADNRHQVLLNGALSLAYPDGFHEMDRSELTQAFQDDNPDRWGIWDRERHIIIAVFWHRSGRLVSRLAKEKDIVKSTEMKVRRGMKQSGYECSAFFSLQAAGRPAEGFRYTFAVQGIRQCAETVVLKDGNTCYTLYYYAREDGPAEDRRVFEEALASLKFREDKG